MTIEIIEIDQIFQDEKTNVWLEFEGESYGISFESFSNSAYAVRLANDGLSATLLDSDGTPIYANDSKNSGVWSKLLPVAVKAMINEAK